MPETKESSNGNGTGWKVATLVFGVLAVLISLSFTMIRASDVKRIDENKVGIGENRKVSATNTNDVGIIKNDIGHMRNSLGKMADTLEKMEGKMHSHGP